MRKAMVYLAGPITRPDPMINAREAIIEAERIMRDYPVVLFTPQLSVFQQFLTPKTHAEWLDYDLHVIEACEGILRLPGDSVGADMEAYYADQRGIPVWYMGDSWEVPADFVAFLSDAGYGQEDDDLASARANTQMYGDHLHDVRYGTAR